MSGKFLFTNGNNPSNPFKLSEGGGVIEFPGNLLQSAGVGNSGATNNFAYIEDDEMVVLSTETYTYLFTDPYITNANNVHVSEISGEGVLFSSYTTCDYALCMINMAINFYAPDQNIDGSGFFFTPVISYEYKSSPNSEFVTGEFAVNDFLHSMFQSHMIYFIINNVYQIKNISVKILKDYITTELEDVSYTKYSRSNLLILFFNNSNNTAITSNNGLALARTANQINNMSIYNGLSINNNKTNCYMMSKYRLDNGGSNIHIDNNTITGNFSINNVSVMTLDNTNIPNYFYTNYNFNNENKFVQYLTFININLSSYYDGDFDIISLWDDYIHTGDLDLYEFNSIFNTSVNDSYKYELLIPCFDTNTDNIITSMHGFDVGDFLFNIFRTSYTPGSSTSGNYINFRSVSDSVTRSTVLSNNVSQCINNSMSFAHFKVENLYRYLANATTQIQPLSYYINSNTTINFNSNIDPSVLSFDSTTNIFTLNGVFAVFATAETNQLYNNQDGLVNHGDSLVIKMGFNRNAPYFFTKIVSLFNSTFYSYSFVASDFSMINALKSITSELYINYIHDDANSGDDNTIRIENLELFFLQLS